MQRNGRKAKRNAKKIARARKKHKENYALTKIRIIRICEIVES